MYRGDRESLLLLLGEKSRMGSEGGDANGESFLSDTFPVARLGRFFIFSLEGVLRARYVRRFLKFGRILRLGWGYNRL